MWDSLLQKIVDGDRASLARAISMVENETPGSEAMLEALPRTADAVVVGITGPPGAGKSTITDLMIAAYRRDGQKVGVICIDPASPFTSGALLGDRVRMQRWYRDEDVFIRSLSTRGTLGGLHPAAQEIADLLAAAGFQRIIIETAGVGQTETSIVSLADVTVVVLVPEGGDDIQAMKSGLLEIANVYVVNKCDRPGAQVYATNLTTASSFADNRKSVPVVMMVASEAKGVEELMESIAAHEQSSRGTQVPVSLATEKALQLIVKRKMKQVDRDRLHQSVKSAMEAGDLNLYRIAAAFM